MKKLVLLGAVALALTHQLVLADVKIIKTNDDVVNLYNKNLSLAKNYLKEVDTETKKSERILKSYKANGLTPEVPAQGRIFIDLQNKGEILFGDNIFIEPFGRCGALGNAASSYWQSKLGNWHRQDSMKKFYYDSIRDCREQIATKPQEEVTVEVSPVSDKSPFKGCLQVVNFDEKAKISTWTCEKKYTQKNSSFIDKQ